MFICVCVICGCTFQLQWQSWVVETDTLWPAIIIDWFYTEKFCWSPVLDLIFKFSVVEPFVLNHIFIWTSITKIYSHTYGSEVRGQVGWTLPTHLPPFLFLPSILQQLFLEGNLRNPRGSKEYSLKMTALQQLFEVVSLILFSILGIERLGS